MEYDSGSNIFVRQMPGLAKGQPVEGHAHNFDHTTYVIRGAILVEKIEDGKVVKSATVRAGPFCWILIRAGVVHRITALEKDTIAHCIYAHRDAQGEVVQRHDGWEKSYG